jgi:hypothetical protein
MYPDTWRNYLAVKEIRPDYCFEILRTMLHTVKRGYLVEEAQFWLPMVELMMPFLSKESTIAN